MVRLVDDHEIELAPDQPLRMFASSCGGDRSDDAMLPPKRFRRVAQERVVAGGEGDAEFILQLFAPLADQRGRRKHQDMLGHAAQRIFLEHHAGLDGLAEPDFVRQQNAAAELLEHFAHRFDLMRKRLDPGEVRQAQELVETLRQAEMIEPLAQAEPMAAGFRRVRDRRQERRHIEVDREGNLDIDPRQRRRQRGGDGRSRRLASGARRCHLRCGFRLDLGPRYALPGLRPDVAVQDILDLAA